jgi:hypothetical protein
MSVRVRAFVDRFEGDQAVLLIGDERSEAVVWPRAFLPSDATVGDVLEVTVETDAEETADRSRAIRRLLSDLGDSADQSVS